MRNPKIKPAVEPIAETNTTIQPVVTIPPVTIVTNTDVIAAVTESQQIPLSGAKLIVRDSNGLAQNIEHKFNEDGTVNWRGMIPSKFVVFNRQKEEEIKKTYRDELKNLVAADCDPKYQLILLAGFKYIAKIRGYNKVIFSRPSYGMNGVSVTCDITWKPNFETENIECIYGDVGGASTNNTSPIGKNKLGEWAYYLETIAANRAFVRAVRNFLAIPTLGFDEIGSSLSEEVSQTMEIIPPYSTLEKKCTAKGIKLEFLIKKAIKERWELESNPSEWTEWKSISPRDSYSLLSIITKEK